LNARASSSSGWNPLTSPSSLDTSRSGIVQAQVSRTHIQSAILDLRWRVFYGGSKKFRTASTRLVQSQFSRLALLR
ncbi:hypothetical protein HDU93_004242, partial [Gonapodya sp. JEL0774]